MKEEDKDIQDFAERHKNKTTREIFGNIYSEHEKEGYYKPNDLFFLEILKHGDLENADKENFLNRAKKLLTEIINKSDAPELKLKNYLLKIEKGLRY